MCQWDGLLCACVCCVVCCEVFCYCASVECASWMCDVSFSCQGRGCLSRLLCVCVSSAVVMPRSLW